MKLNNPAENQAVAAKLLDLQARADQQPISYKYLFDQAMEVACDQFKRAMAAEARLFKSQPPTAS